MIAVIDEERRFNQAAALLSPRSAEKVRYEWKARRAAAVLATIRHALAGHGKGSRLPVDRRQFDAYIDTLIETELDTCRDASSGLNAPGARA
ncbi:MAG: hypothetical protein JSS21_01565 [Proteobacteria bacterium]|nr:hypothetical protein [Pseudomonadota bacterium]